ncbi:hypothetical protein Csa_010972 [Cucumis sativus]|uniref:Uncharacterized protein n=1 Tax=Cucumis sativus TaxID=3659 RepID=A0A0A0L8U4_CUCSA|nr:hypothetical protein Csa_010972 [Cucumis sativus]
MAEWKEKKTTDYRAISKAYGLFNGQGDTVRMQHSVLELYSELRNCRLAFRANGSNLINKTL